MPHGLSKTGPNAQFKNADLWLSTDKSLELPYTNQYLLHRPKTGLAPQHLRPSLTKLEHPHPGLAGCASGSGRGREGGGHLSEPRPGDVRHAAPVFNVEQVVGGRGRTGPGEGNAPETFGVSAVSASAGELYAAEEDPKGAGSALFPPCEPVTETRSVNAAWAPPAGAGPTGRGGDVSQRDEGSSGRTRPAGPALPCSASTGRRHGQHQAPVLEGGWGPPLSG
ncbi:hypothetical protein AAFF_G00025500 [Aldrovandia affinis]|uniref:Uncharacterized protein n=1 Tax=Aldrovandia affinis TaxID=143900 RepID=A0AAD7S544_9TELE|nr:hypothetical protein AAFF_G00025500 [Aldrovandia affinis]